MFRFEMDLPLSDKRLSDNIISVKFSRWSWSAELPAVLFHGGDSLRVLLLR